MAALVSVLFCSSVIHGGETLYNGIVLPDQWPPVIPELTLDPPPDPPYLQSPPAVIPIDVGRQLFVDDFLIDSTSLGRTYHQPVHLPANPVLAPPHTGGGKTHSDGVWYDPQDQTFKMWYRPSDGLSTRYATSADGINWALPNLDVVPGTNIVHGGQRALNTVWLDHDDPNPERRFKMFRFEKSPTRGLVVHYSPDGIHWSDEIRRAGPCYDRTSVFYNPFREKWVFSIKGYYVPIEGEDRRFRRYHEGDSIAEAANWSTYGEPGLWTNADRLDPVRNTAVDPDPAPSDIHGNQTELYALDAIAYESIMLGAFLIFHGNGDGTAESHEHMNDVTLAYSRDGFHWTRPDRRAFLGVSDSREDWNWTNVQIAGGLCLVVDDYLYFYCSGQTYNPDKQDSTGLAVLRRDGFASMDAGDEGGVLTTRTVTFEGKHLFVNVAAAEGELRAEVLDADGQVIAPFSRDNCVAVSVNDTSRSVTWEGAESLEALRGQPVQFRFYLENGSLYAFWVSPSAAGQSNGYVAAGGPGFTGSRDSVPRVPGDANLDGLIDDDDLSLLLANWTGAGGSSGTWGTGDFDENGAVSDVDLSFLLANWGQGGAESVWIPEPATIVCLVLAGPVLLRGRRGRSYVT